MIDFVRYRSFWSRVDHSDVDGCWPWKGAIRKGVGRLEFGGRKTDPRRVAYMVAIGEIPKGRWVTSGCKNYICCRPDHFVLKGLGHDKPEVPGFWEFVVKTQGCWHWTGPETIEFAGRTQPPWRVAYLLTRRHPVPRGAFITQNCGTGDCVRPGHLEPAWLHGQPPNLPEKADLSTAF